ncbi:hypothetical protein IMZ48_07490 [Candidatus Bathyarchaeota archaeon]|nr:hypothetical protein [Candidatus Bathyarchaeota archaeon]
MSAVFIPAWEIIRTAMENPGVDMDVDDMYVDVDDMDVDVELERIMEGMGTGGDDSMPTNSDLLVEDSVARHSGGATNSNASSLSGDTTRLQQERIFDLPHHTSTINTMTAATSQPTTKAGAISTSQTPGGTLAQEHMAIAADERQTPANHPGTLSDVGEDVCGYESDMDTIYSLASQESNLNHSYIQPFLDQFSNDCPEILSDSGAPGAEPEYLEKALKEFASRLHAESSNPFQWGAAVTLHKTRQ